MEIAKGLIETLKDICLCFKEADIRFCLVGGLAVAILAKPRSTEDIDLLVLLQEENRKQLEIILRDKFKVAKVNEVMHFKNAAIWRVLLHNPSADDKGFLIVDFIFADNDIYRDAIKNRIQITVDDVEIPVAAPEDLIKIKQLANRPQDLIDIEMLRKEGRE